MLNCAVRPPPSTFSTIYAEPKPVKMCGVNNFFYSKRDHSLMRNGQNS